MHDRANQATWRTEAAALLVLAVATLYAAHPWGFLGEAVSGHRDRIFHNIAMQRLQDVMLHGGDWRASPLAWPFAWGVTQADWVAGQALLALPLELAGVSPAHQHGVLILAGLLGTAWATHRVAVALLGPGPHTWLAGIGAGLSTYALGHTAHVNLVHHELAVIGALLLADGLRRDRPARAALGGAIAGLSVHFGFYMGAHAAAVVAIVLLAAPFVGWRSLRAHLAGWVGLGIVGATALPVALVYREHSQKYDIHISAIELGAQSLDPTTLLRPASSVPLHVHVADALGLPIRPDWDPFNPGYLFVALTIAGLWALRRDPKRHPAWPIVGAVVVASLLLALGPRLQVGGPTPIPGPYALFVDVFPIAASLRGPVRFVGVAWIGTALLAAAGARALAARSGRPNVVYAALLGLAFVEMPADSAVVPAAILRPHAIYEKVNALEGVGALYDVPRGTDACTTEQRITAVLDHRRSVVGGTWARSSAAASHVNRVALAWPSPAADGLFRRIGVRWVLLHPPIEVRMPDEGVSCETIDDHLLCELVGDGPPALPGVDAVTTEAIGEVIGVRWPSEPGAPPPPRGDPLANRKRGPQDRGVGTGPVTPITVTCDGASIVSAPPPTWRAVSAMRDPAGGFAIFFDRPCADPKVSVAGGELLYRVPGVDTTWPGAPLGPRQADPGRL